MQRLRKRWGCLPNADFSRVSKIRCFVVDRSELNTFQFPRLYGSAYALCSALKNLTTGVLKQLLRVQWPQLIPPQGPFCYALRSPPPPTTLLVSVRASGLSPFSNFVLEADVIERFGPPPATSMLSPQFSNCGTPIDFASNRSAVVRSTILKTGRPLVEEQVFRAFSRRVAPSHVRSVFLSFPARTTSLSPASRHRLLAS